MKKIAISAGLVAISAAGIQTALADVSGAISPKAWSMGATLRGFYDDDYNTSKASLGSAGIEVSPTISVNLPLRQTDFGMRYTYGIYYYQDRQDKNVNPFDQTHQFEVWLDHKFNAHWDFSAKDAFAVGQEPELLRSGASNPLRLAGDNIANHADLSLDTEWSKGFNTSLHYGNAFYDYQNSLGGTALPNVAAGAAPTMPDSTPVSVNTGVGGNFYSLATSYAGTLNRVEQTMGIDLKWEMGATTMLLVGYNFSLANYTGDQDVAVFNYYDAAGDSRSLIYRSKTRDSFTHYAFVGMQHQFSANINGTIRVGGSYTDNYNDPLSNNTSFAPYVDLSLSYTYTPGSYVQFGITHDVNATQVVQPSLSTGQITLNQESSVVYASLNHKFSPSLMASIIGRFQNSTYNGGFNDGVNDQSYGAGANLSYQINRHFSTEVGYNFDESISGVNGYSFERNRVYLGLSANY